MNAPVFIVVSSLLLMEIGSASIAAIVAISRIGSEVGANAGG